jgi:hypothetical protein
MELTGGDLISAKMRSHCALYHAFTSVHIEDVSAVKSAQSFFLLIAATLVLRRSIFTSCFSNIIVHRASYYSSLATTLAVTPAMHFSINAR